MPALIVWDWGWQRPGVVPAMPGHLLAYYTYTKFVIQAPRGDEFYIPAKENHHTASPNSVVIPF
jgi:hypothetical protein